MTAFAPQSPERFNAPLYEATPDDWQQQARDFTVTVAGPERHDGEAPYTYVVRDHSTGQAWIQALTCYMRENEQLDAYVVVSESHEGPPPQNAGYHWNDLRPEARRQAHLRQLISQARELSDRFDLAVAPYHDDDGEVRPDAQILWDQERDEAEWESWDLVRELAAFAREPDESS